MKKAEKKYYSKEYKLKAIALSEQRESTHTVALELGIRADMLSRWKREHAKDRQLAFKGAGHAKKKKEASIIAKLNKELRDVTLERDILKKAVSIFSKSDSTDLGLS